MDHVAIDDVDPTTNDPDLTVERRELTGPLATDHLAITHYVLEPGERCSGSVHAHADQEEVFVVLEGTATFVTRADDGGEYTEVAVDDGEAIRVPPGEFQSGRNDGPGRVVALALGAPRDSEDVRIDRIPVLDDRDVACPDCECDHMRVSRREGVELECPDCGATLTLESSQ